LFDGYFEEGKMHGDAVEVNEAGIRTECSYVNGERHGTFKEFDREGNLIASGEYNQGKRIEK
jgi:antitoxin component YwqK of YwqJK toxin-antitoxin module